jgi:hypothetical protein
VEGLEIRTVGEEVLVHDPAARQVHVLNLSAGQVLELCDGAREIDDIVVDVSRRTGVGADVVNADVTRIIDEFRDLGLVR